MSLSKLHKLIRMKAKGSQSQETNKSRLKRCRLVLSVEEKTKGKYMLIGGFVHRPIALTYSLHFPPQLHHPHPHPHTSFFSFNLKYL